MSKQDVNRSPAAKPTLWDHQEQAIAAILRELPSSRPIMVQIPTGGGKSRVIGEVVRRLPPHQRILIITTRIDLVVQNRDELDDHGVFCDSITKKDRQSGIDPALLDTIGTAVSPQNAGQYRVNIGTYHTMIGMMDMPTPDVILVDECHMVPERGGYMSLLERFPHASLVGLTATPFRGTTHLRECGIDWHTVFGVTIAELISKKILVPPVSMSTAGVSCQDVLASDEKQGRQEVTRDICMQLCNSVKRHDRQKNLVFCEDIAHAQNTAALLREQGESEVYVIHHHDSLKRRKAIYAAFNNCPHRSWLVNVMLVSIGVNLRSIDCVALLRDVTSYSLLVQMIGRGLRQFPGKRDCLVFDFGRGTHRFGFLDSPNFKDKPAAGGFVFKECPICGANAMLGASICNHCHHEFPLRQDDDAEICSLKTQASATQLISNDYVVLTYDAVELELQNNGSVRLEHRLHDSAGMAFQSTEFRRNSCIRTLSAQCKSRFIKGQTWLSRRIDRPGVKVQLITLVG